MLHLERQCCSHPGSLDRVARPRACPVMSATEPPPRATKPFSSKPSSKPVYIAVGTLAVLVVAGLSGLAYELSSANARVAAIEVEVKALHEHAHGAADSDQFGKLERRVQRIAEKLSASNRSIRDLISVRVPRPNADCRSRADHTCFSLGWVRHVCAARLCFAGE